MINSTTCDYWTPKAFYSERELAMATCLKDISRMPTYPAVSAAITNDLAGMVDELEEPDQENLAVQLEMEGANSQEMALALMERSIVSQILADVDWDKQKANQPPTTAIIEAIEELTVWDYLNSAMVMR